MYVHTGLEERIKVFKIEIDGFTATCMIVATSLYDAEDIYRKTMYKVGEYKVTLIANLSEHKLSKWLSRDTLKNVACINIKNEWFTITENWHESES